MNNEFDKIEELLYSEAKKIQPSADGLRSVLNRIVSPVTKFSGNRLFNKEASKGRALRTNSFEYINIIMKSFWKVVIPVGLVVVALAAIGYWRFSAGIINAPDNQDMAQTIITHTEFASAGVTESVDEIVNSTIDDEALAFIDTDDAILADYDEQALMDFDNLTSLYE
ncbi:MAG: hypothetical protein WC931_02100 [Bacilli bacterium]|jgi:hypothetical protein